MTQRRDYSRPPGKGSKLNSFIAWIGGKRILRTRIITILPTHKTYVEVFGGAGWVLFGKEPSEVEVWNDLNSGLVNLFRVVRNRLQAFERRQYFLLSSRAEYDTFQVAIKTGRFKDDVDRAIAFYYCLRNSFGSGIFTGWAFGPGRPPKYAAGLAHLREARERLKHVYIDNLSFERLIPNWDRPETLFYCDPPYTMLLNKGGRAYYQHGFTSEDHTRLRDVLTGIKGKFILSYDDSPLVRKLYKGFKVHEVGKVSYPMNNRPGSSPRFRPEVIITNF